jgi:putative membrane protein
MLSWIRTATSLITFGFSVYKFFQIERKKEVEYLVGPEGFGLLLVAIGLVSLLLATWEFRANLRTLGIEYSAKLRSPTVVLAALISVLGIAAFIIILLRR